MFRIFSPVLPSSSYNFLKLIKLRNYSTSIKLTNLSSQRSLVKLSGSDTLPYLQGLITNDIAHLQSKPCIYALFLNHLGRVLYDTLIISGGESGGDEVIVECDSEVREDLIKYLNKFKLRKKVKPVKEDELEVSVLYNDSPEVILESLNASQSELLELRRKSDEILKSTLDSLSLPPSTKYFADPRLPELGYRLLLPKKQGEELISSKLVNSSPIGNYTRLRYTLGVAEGSKELPPGSCFPLESNGDYLHGISFQKGCYIGQELTARTHHTGVVRKRIMPIKLNSSVSNLEGDLLNPANPKKSLGKLRGVCGTSAVGLVRVEDASTSKEIKIGNTLVSIVKPFWWAKKEVHKL